jgi:hypothetical protein
VPLWSWYTQTATCRPWSRCMTVPTRCWPVARTGSASRSATGPTPSPSEASSPAWTSLRRQRSLTTEDDTLGCPKWLPSAGRQWSRSRHAWQCLRPLQHHPRLCRCGEAITTWTGARNCFFSTVPGVFWYTD